MAVTGIDVPPATDYDEIVRVVRLYVEGFNDCDAARVEQSIHPELAKRIVRATPLPARDHFLGDPWLEHMGALRLVQETRHAPRDAGRRFEDDEVTILDRFENAASVKLGSSEYHHVARYNGCWLIVNILGGLQPLRAQAHGETDEAAIRRTALGYVESCYAADPARMEATLHPDLAKRIVVPNGLPDGDRFDHMSALALVQLLRGDPAPGEGLRADVTLLDRSENAASVRTDAVTWMDYMHLVRSNGRWTIVNVLWVARPEVA